MHISALAARRQLRDMFSSFRVAAATVQRQREFVLISGIAGIDFVCGLERWYGEVEFLRTQIELAESVIGCEAAGIRLLRGAKHVLCLLPLFCWLGRGRLNLFQGEGFAVERLAGTQDGIRAVASGR